MAILAATQNQHKLHEFRGMLGKLGIIVQSAYEVAVIPAVAENGQTFEENAIVKATELAAETGKHVFSDDSGLEVFALGGEPGVHSARYAGSNATDEECVDKLLAQLQEKDDRSARFVCVIAVAAPSGLIGTARGEIRGTIARSRAGCNGFGYDPVFIAESYTKTFAEIDQAQKDAVSHRSRALKNAIDMGLFNTLIKH